MEQFSKEEFLKVLTGQIRCEKAREGVEREVAAHIEDAASNYESKGMNHEEAIKEAVAGMGDPVAVGVELDRIHRPKMDWHTLVMIIILSFGGLLAQYTVSGSQDLSLSGISRYVVAQLSFTLIGLAVTIGICFVDYSILGRYWRACYWLLTAGMAILCVMFQDRYNGTFRICSIVPFLYVPVYAGVLYGHRNEGIRGILKGIAYMWIPLLFSSRGSITSSMVMWIICYSMLLYGVWRRWFQSERKYAMPALIFIAFVLPVLYVIFFYFFRAATYQKVRLESFFHANAYANTSGYIYQVLREILNSCRLVGQAQVDVMFPFDRDWVLLQLMMSYGLVCGFAVTAAMAVFVVRIFKVTRRVHNRLGSMIGVGCGMTILTECIMGIGMNFGVFPSTSVFMPFLTYGISTTMVYAVYSGLLLSICRYRSVLTDSEVKHKRYRYRIVREEE